MEPNRTQSWGGLVQPTTPTIYLELDRSGIEAPKWGFESTSECLTVSDWSALGSHLCSLSPLVFMNSP